MLEWPFGIWDDDLLAWVAAASIESPLENYRKVNGDMEKSGLPVRIASWMRS